MGQSFSQQTLKVNAKMAVSRLSLMRSKKSNILPNLKREIANLLSQGKVQSAEIKAESLIHEENLILATEVLELHCEKLGSRVSQIALQQKCPEDVFLSIATIVYCSTRLPVPEFKGIATQMALKYTKAWIMPLNERKQYVDPKVSSLIDVVPPNRSEIIQKLTQLAQEFQVDYECPEDETPIKPPHKDAEFKLPVPVEDPSAALHMYENEDKNPAITVSPKETRRQSELQELESLKALAQGSNMAELPDEDLSASELKIPEDVDDNETFSLKPNQPEAKKNSEKLNEGGTPDIDALMKRLEALKTP